MVTLDTTGREALQPARRANAMTAASTAESAWQLQSALRDIVHLPGDAEYEALCRVWHLTVRQTPTAVAQPRSADEVAAVVRHAAKLGLRVAPQNSGHAAPALNRRDLSDVVLVRVGKLNSVRIDPYRRVASIGGGAVRHQVVPHISEHGLAALHGSASDVGVVGFTLSGGVGWLMRKYGLAANHVVSVELVTADGIIRRVTEANDPELFWALRGGNAGNFGIVTEIEIGLHSVRDVYSGLLLWDISRAETVLPAWLAWTAQAPDHITTSFRIMRYPQAPNLPPFLSGRHVVVVDGASLAADDEAAAALATLRSLRPERDTFARSPVTGLVTLHGDPPGPTATVGYGGLVNELDDDGIAAFLSVVGPNAPTALRLAELRQLGGAAARPAPNGGAVSALPAPYLLYTSAPAQTPNLAAAGTEGTAALHAALRPWLHGQTYLNFTSGEFPVRNGFEPLAYDRLRGIRNRLDPDAVFLANHAIN
jgi:FAD/FMN-containing dehydrogenase